MGCGNGVGIPGGAERKCREEDLRPQGGGKDTTTDNGGAGIKTARTDILAPAGLLEVMATLVDEIEEGSPIADSIPITDSI